MRASGATGEGSRGSVNENAKANAVGVGCVRCARAHLPFGLRGAPAQSFVVAVGSARSIPIWALTDPARKLRVEEIFHSRGQISPHMAGISSLGRRGCSQDGRGEAGAAERDTADDFFPRRCCSLRVELCSGEAAAFLFWSSLRRAVDPGDDPGVCRAAMCMICPAVLPAMPVASSISRAAGERGYCQKGPRLVQFRKKVRCRYISK